MKRYFIWALKAALTVGIIYFLITSQTLDLKGILSHLITVEALPFIALAVFFFYLSNVLAAMRLKYLLELLSYNPSLLYVFRLTLIGNFFNLVMPGVIGGDVVKVYYLLRDESTNRGRSAGIVMFDRVIGLTGIIVVALLSIVYLVQYGGNATAFYRSEILLAFSIGAAFVVLFALLILFGKHGGLRAILKNILERVLKKNMLYYTIEGIGKSVKRRRRLALPIALGICIQVLSLMGIMSLFMCIPGESSNFLILMAVSSIVVFLGVIPLTPGNLGWTELVAELGWTAFGSESGAEVFLYWRIITILCSLPGGVMYLMLKHGRDASELKRTDSDSVESTEP